MDGSTSPRSLFTARGVIRTAKVSVPLFVFLLVTLLFLILPGGVYSQPPVPSFSVRLSEQQVHGYDWPLAAAVTLVIDDPAIPGAPDYSDTQTVVVADWDSTQTFVRFDLNNVFALHTGQAITLTDGLTPKAHTVVPLTVTAVDPIGDTVSGSTSPGAVVHIGHICDENDCAFRREFADATGNWLANFSVPGDDGDEQETFDIRPGTSNEARVPDGDGDTTNVQWYVPYPPTVMAFPLYVHNTDELGNQVFGNGWTAGMTITLSIDDPANGPDWDYTDSLIALPGQNCFAGSQLCFQLDPSTFQLQPDQIIRLSDGVTTKIPD